MVENNKNRVLIAFFNAAASKYFYWYKRNRLRKIVCDALS